MTKSDDTAEALTGASQFNIGVYETARDFHKAEPTKAQLRQMFNFLAMGYIPSFRIGRTICTRKSEIERFVSQQETATTPKEASPQRPKRHRAA